MVYRITGPSFEEVLLEKEGWKFMDCAREAELGEKVLKFAEQYPQISIIKVRGKPYETVYQIRARGLEKR